MRDMPQYEVDERIVINASPAKVREVVRSFKDWEAWSPWFSSEPDCDTDYPEDGKSYSWDGKIIGAGNMRITSESEERIDYKLTFLRPFKSQSDVAFFFRPKGEGTEVSWTMKASLPFFLFFLKKMMAAWIASDFRRGLAKLKDYVETGDVPSKQSFDGVGEGLVSPYVGIRSTVSLASIGDELPKQLQRLGEWAEKANVDRKAPLALYHKFNVVANTTEYTVALPVDSLPDDVPSEFVTGTVNAPKTYKVSHKGAYRHLGAAWSAGMMHQRGKRFRRNKGCDPFELYVSDPSQVSEADILTEVHFPAR